MFTNPHWNAWTLVNELRLITTTGQPGLNPRSWMTPSVAYTEIDINVLQDAVDLDHFRVSSAGVAEIPFTALTNSRPIRQRVTARLIVRRVKRLNPDAVQAGPDELFTTWRHHAVFTDNPKRCSRPKPPTVAA
jgi:hypothetical protein